MRSEGGTRFWVRGTLLTAIAGHGISNLVFDADQYERVGSVATWSAHLPLLAQTVLVAIAICVVGRRGGAPAPITSGIGRGALLIALTAAQLGLFLLFETSERLIQRTPFEDGIFGSGFTLELVLAVGAALLLFAIGAALAGIARTLRRQPARRRMEAERLAPPIHRRPTSRPAGSPGDGRAPPLAA